MPPLASLYLFFAFWPDLLFSLAFCQILGEIEEHLNCIVQQVGLDLKLEVNEFDGKVVYGAKRAGAAYRYDSHVEQLAADVRTLSQLETQVQSNYLRFYRFKKAIV